MAKGPTYESILKAHKAAADRAALVLADVVSNRAFPAERRLMALETIDALEDAIALAGQKQRKGKA